ALALATLIRHTAGAISAYVVVILILQLIVGALPVSLQNAIHRFLPSTVGNSLISSNAGPYTFSPWVGLIVLCGYTLGLLLIGTAVLRRRDA
ncbi:MAG: ABC transporter permease, partial [Acidimicrobiales bacterium]